MNEQLLARTARVLHIAIASVGLLGGHVAQAAVIFSAGPTTPTLGEVSFILDGEATDGPDVANQVLYENGGSEMRMIGDAVIDIVSTRTRGYGARLTAFGADVSTVGEEPLSLLWDFDVEVTSGSPVFDVTLRAFTRVGELAASETSRVLSGISKTTHFEGSAIGEFTTIVGGSANLSIDLSFRNRAAGDQVILTMPEGGGLWITQIPEPRSLALLGLGGVLLALRRRIQVRRASSPVPPPGNH